MAVLALITNWVRVLTIIEVGYTTQMRHVLVTRYHVQFGYVLYALAFLLFVAVARLTLPKAAISVPPLSTSPGSMHYLAAQLALVAAPLLFGVFALLR
jgi:hypothetical protein